MGFIKHGVHRELEAAADEMIRQSLVGVTSMEAKRDILTPWKEKDRRDREVYSSTGVPDSSYRSGMYHRAWNPRDAHLNSRPNGSVGGRTSGFGSLAEHVAENGHGGFVPGDADA